VWALQPQQLGHHWYEPLTDHAPEWLLAIFTGLLAFVTYRLVQSTNKLWEAGERQTLVAEKAANAAQLSADFIPRVERAYLTGGGDVEIKNGKRFFRAEVANYGKTPAFLHHFDIRFSTLAEVSAKLLPVEPRWPYDDRIPADNKTKALDGINALPIPDDMNVVYGAFYYQDWLKREHRFRFILQLGLSRTLPIITGVEESYREWD
jgi:hypothetical protein